MRWPFASRFSLVVALLLALAAPALAGGGRPAVRFIPLEGKPGLAKVQKRGKLAVSRNGDRLRVRAYVPATRNGVDGVEIHTVERKAGDAQTPSDVADAVASFEEGIDIAIGRSWRRDLTPRDHYKGALKRLRSKRTLDEVTAFDHALDGVARNLRVDEGPLRDKWTEYQDEKSYAQARARRAGAGLALGVSGKKPKRGEGIHIARVTPGSAAARAGLRKGDRLLLVGRKKVTLDNWTEALTSKEDRSFDITVRARGGAVRTVTLKREPTRWPLQIQRTREGMGVVRFNDGFTEGIAQEIHDGLLGLEKRGPLRGIVIDLRGNGGGAVEEAQNLLDDLVTSGNLGVYQHGDGKREDRDATGKATFGHLPLAVLIDGDSASMSDHVPNVLKALAATRGVVILGEKSYGKGLMQTTFKLKRGALKISTATFSNGDLRTTQGNPVEPDITVEEASRRQRAAHPGVRVVDPVLREAVAELARMTAGRPTAPRALPAPRPQLALPRAADTDLVTHDAR
ncbi:MAG TPA: S41 family peptidase [Kofleriaceae bacterium]|nr:S41 family peptidase [Kofleriaceae bacterium]